MDIKSSINSLKNRQKKHFDEIQSKIDWIESAHKEYPDLEVKTYHRSDMFYSKSLDSVATSFVVQPSSSCCANTDLQLYVSIKYNGEQIYTSYSPLVIGSDYEDYYFRENWENQLKQYNVPELLIQKLKEFIEENQCKDDESEDY